MQHEVTIWAWVDYPGAPTVNLSLDEPVWCEPEWEESRREWRTSYYRCVCPEEAERLVGEPVRVLKNQTWPYGYTLTGDYNGLAKVL